MKNNQISNYQDLLKFIGIIAVFLDHFGLYFMQDYTILRVLGRFAMPIFCFFVGFNFKKPNIKLLIYGSILTSIFAIFFNIFCLNMLITMYIGHWYLYITDKYSYNSKTNIWTQLIILVAIMPLISQYVEYGSIAIAIILLGNLKAKNILDYKMMIFTTISLIIFTQENFEFSFINSILSAIILSIASYLLFARNHSSKINLNLRYISRNSLIIYFWNVTLSICIFMFKSFYGNY